MQKLREQCFGKEIFPPEVLEWIERENLWNLWVPKNHGGLELPFSEGLLRLKELAEIDGSLGWTVTLCSGANYFIGNLKPEAAENIFLNAQKPVCFGGSGGASGTAEKSGDHYMISGKWRYATGAPYLTHFTLNARITENQKELTNPDGSAVVRSFLVPAKEVKIIKDWDTMGLKATATHSFELNNVRVHSKHSFLYNEFYLPQPVFKINFSLFADLTLWVNYVGMAAHYFKAATQITKPEKTSGLEKAIFEAEQNISAYAREIEEITTSTSNFSEEYIQGIHSTAALSVEEISQAIIKIHPHLGVKGCSKISEINQVFRDYFTATQHHIFTK
ncbi:acyl-CoA dehydrogenase [Salinimicrobium catena]|uniref:acyl-CoA dehydrogenase n=1 Tax=Salinimicrobium catena TaxID=390640 RepID=UPI002FE4727A